jgi:molecular chaperone GrpE (heat shock protein)
MSEGTRREGVEALDETGATEGSPELAEEHAAEEALAGQLDALQAEVGSLNDRHLRLAAEFQNYRRRAESEMTEAWSRAQAMVAMIAALVPFGAFWLERTRLSPRRLHARTAAR